MARVEQITLSCDLCGKEGEGVTTHQLGVDGHEVWLEVCSRCWKRPESVLAPLLTAGRKAQTPRRGRR